MPDELAGERLGTEFLFRVQGRTSGHISATLIVVGSTPAVLKVRLGGGAAGRPPVEPWDAIAQTPNTTFEPQRPRPSQKIVSVARVKPSVAEIFELSFG